MAIVASEAKSALGFTWTRAPFKRKARNRWVWRANGMAAWATKTIVRWVFLARLAGATKSA